MGPPPVRDAAFFTDKEGGTVATWRTLRKRSAISRYLFAKTTAQEGLPGSRLIELPASATGLHLELMAESQPLNACHAHLRRPHSPQGKSYTTIAEDFH